MTPQTVNAYFNPVQNEIVFLLQFYKHRSLTLMLTQPITMAQ